MSARDRDRSRVFADPRNAVSLLAMGVFVVMLVGTSKSPSPTPPSPGVTFSTSGGGAEQNAGGAPSPSASGQGSVGRPAPAPPLDGGARASDAGVAVGRTPTLLRGPLAEALPIGTGELDALRFRHEGAAGVREVEAQYVATLMSRGYAVTTRKADPKRKEGRVVQLSRSGEQVVLRLAREETAVVVSLRLQSTAKAD